MNNPVPREVMTKGGPMKVADVLLSDDSGEIQLSLWNEDISKVSVGNTIVVDNGYVTTWRGTNKLSIGRFGTLTVRN